MAWLSFKSFCTISGFGEGVLCVGQPNTPNLPHSYIQAAAVMASASSTSAKNLFADSKSLLARRVQVNVSNMGSICRQINRGSQSADMLTHSARNMALQVSNHQ